jgi:hypothetical protein
VRRLAVAGLFAFVFVAACGDEDSPTFETEDGTPLTAAPPSSSTTTSSTTATTARTQPQELTLTLAGEGTAEATLTYDGDQLCVRGTTDGVGALTSGRIHAGPAGENGPPVVDLGVETAGDGPFEGCATVGAEGGVVFVDPTSYYLSLATADHPDGAVRAQLG